MVEANTLTRNDMQAVSSGEALFRPEEVLYSRTDKRGVIFEANSGFQRVSGHSWADLKGAPHKLIRHPDTPKGVFHLMWARLKADKPVVAYVKNLTKEGRYYWVLATTWPTADGYMSVRIKPSSELFKEIPGLYASLQKQEAEGLTPEQSADALVEMIKENGFRNYDAFMNAAIARESAARQEAIGAPDNLLQRRFGDMYQTILRLGSQTDEMTEVIKAIRSVPINMRILASRLENAGGPISAISVNYGSMLDEMATWVRDFVDGDSSAYSLIHNAIQRGQFLVCAAALQRELSESFQQDISDASTSGEVAEDPDILRGEAQAFEAKVASALKTVEAEVTHLSRNVLDMKRYVTGLSSTRMMCKIESAALHGTGDSSLAGIVDQLDAGQNEIEEKLAGIVQLNSVIQGHTSMVRSLT